jgi:hypothetical protein
MTPGLPRARAAGKRRERDGVLPPISERRFQTQVLELARLHHWRAYHTWNSMHSAGGFPDLVLVRRGRLIFAELKAERGKLSNDQLNWHYDLAGCPCETYVWRPSDFDEIARVLSA